jgi:hypothetical protein
MLAARITLPHFSVSSAISFRASIDHQLELGWKLYGQLADLCATEDAVDKRGSTPPYIRYLRSVSHQGTFGGEGPDKCYGRKPVLRRQMQDKFAIGRGRKRGQNNQSAVRLGSECIGCTHYVKAVEISNLVCLHVQHARRFLDRRKIRGRSPNPGDFGFNEREPLKGRDSLLEQPQPFASNGDKKISNAGDIAFGMREAFHDAISDDVTRSGNDNGNGLRLLLHCPRRRCAFSDHHVRSKANQLCRKSNVSVETDAAEAEINPYIAAYPAG